MAFGAGPLARDFIVSFLANEAAERLAGKNVQPDGEAPAVSTVVHVDAVPEHQDVYDLEGEFVDVDENDHCAWCGYWWEACICHDLDESDYEYPDD